MAKPPLQQNSLPHNILFLSPRNFHGSVSFIYIVSDSNYPLANVTANVTLIVVPPAALEPANYTHVGLYDTPFTPSTNLLLARVNSSNPDANLTVVGIISPPNSSDGNVTVEPNGNFTFFPNPGWYGEFPSHCC
jgi:hypothetical protein